MKTWGDAIHQRRELHRFFIWRMSECNLQDLGSSDEQSRASSHKALCCKVIERTIPKAASQKNFPTRHLNISLAWCLMGINLMMSNSRLSYNSFYHSWLSHGNLFGR